MSMKRIEEAFLADTARVIGQVTLGLDVSIWYGVAIRGDVAPIEIGPGTNVQDNAVVHCDHGKKQVIGPQVTIGHGAIVHGLEVGENSLIGMGATVLGGCRIGQGCLIAAGAVVPPNLQVPDGMVVMGVPGRVVRPVTDQEREYLKFLPPHYIRLATLHAQGGHDPRTRPFGADVPSE